MVLRSLLLLMLLLASAGARGQHGPADLAFERVDCAGAACGPDWSWVGIADVDRLAVLDRDWRLLVDQTRFDAIRVEVVHGGRITVIARRADAMQDSWSLGGNLALAIPVPGDRIEALRVGFERIDSLSLLRSLKALSPADHAAHMERWAALIAFVVGVLACSLVYNLFMLTWLRSSFQVWYVVWVATAIVYSLVWSGAIYYVLPDLAGHAGVRLIYALVGLLIAAATCFFFALIEPGRLPPRLIAAGRLSAAAVFVSGLVAAADLIVPMYANDRLLNITFILAMLTVAAGVVAAIRAGSRTVWFYLIGWTPPFLVFALRVARNFGFMPASELIDMASFATIAFEAMMLSLAIANRFRELRRRQTAAEVERDTMRRLSETDALTGLANRAAFQARLATLRQVPADLVVTDLDYLKETNDTAGHDAGDALILEVGRRLRAAAGDHGLVARIGGDEFAVLLEGEACAVLPDVLREVERSTATVFHHHGRLLPLSLSAGHVAWAPGGPDPHRLYKDADLALYRAKADGRGRWCRYSDAMREDMEAGRRTVVEARAGLARGEFELHYQPIVELRSGEPIGCEGLLRWWHPIRGLLTPPAFSAAFADPGVAAAIQSFALDDALDHAACAAPLRTGANFIAAQLQGAGAAEAILARLAERGIQPDRFVVEIAEGVVIGRTGGPIIECLQRLRAGGVSVALDDFGTGYASLVHLRDLPADILKIARPFVAGLPDDPTSRTIVRAIIELAHDLGRRVIAEGIETEIQRDHLRELGCDAGQGHLIGYPTRPAFLTQRRIFQAA